MLTRPCALRSFALVLLLASACTRPGSADGGAGLKLEAVEPAAATWGAPVPVVLKGHFRPRVQANAGSGELTSSFAFSATLGEFALEQVRFVDATTLEALVPLSVATPGAYAIEVVDPDGNRAQLADAFTLLPAPLPAIASVTPAALQAASEGALLISGEGFLPGAQVSLGSAVLPVRSVARDRVEATYPAGTLVPGVYALTVTNRDGGSGRRDAAVTVIGGLSRLRVEVLGELPKIAGEEFDVRLTALDDAGQPATAFDGTVALADATGTLTPARSGAFSAGVRLERVRITRAATQTAVEASVPGLQGQSASFEVRHATPSSLTVTPDRPDYMPGSTARLSVRLEDGYGNP
ncbi:MAG: IPT/TIG domain-containing protein, partial [Myxococcales bacterium]